MNGAAHADEVFVITHECAAPLGHGELDRLATRLAMELRMSAETAPFVTAVSEAALDVVADVLDELADFITGRTQMVDCPTLASLVAQQHSDG